jgi:PAS domain S-box-containing protein
VSNPQQPLLSLAADIGTALTCCDSVDDVIQHCAEALVRNLEAAFARIWVYDDSTRMLILRASAGLYTHVDGAHSRIALGALKIGQIAQDRQPHMTNEVWNDPRVSDKDWARETGMVAFAGHPLLVNDQLIGVMAMFSTKPLSETTTRALASVADGVALGIHRKQIEGRLREREQLFMQFANNMQDVLWLSRPHAQQTLWISPAVEQVMGVKPEDVYENPYAFMEVIIPEDRPRMAQFMEMTETLRADSPKKTTDVEYRIRKDGELRWLWTRAFPSFDGEGKIYQICGFTHDITEKKEAERRVSEFYSTVSHELRTPLTSIRAALGLIEGGVTHPEAGSGSFDPINQRHSRHAQNGSGKIAAEDFAVGTACGGK